MPAVALTQSNSGRKRQAVDLSGSDTSRTDKTGGGGGNTDKDRIQIRKLDLDRSAEAGVLAGERTMAPVARRAKRGASVPKPRPTDSRALRSATPSPGAIDDLAWHAACFSNAMPRTRRNGSAGPGRASHA